MVHTLLRSSQLAIATLMVCPLLMPGIAWSQAPGEQDIQSTVRMAQVNTPRRVFAPGVVRVIPTQALAESTFSDPEPYVDILQGIPNLDWTPNYLAETRTLKSKASDVILRRDIWSLEFAFKPLRTIEVSVPQPSGKLQRKLIWYMVYRVKNLGDPLRRSPVKDEFGNITYEVRQVEGLPTQPIRFFPRFVLRTQRTEPEKEYLDRVIPVAAQVIADRETGGVKLYNTVEISRFDIPVSTPDEDKSVWGVVTWEDVDPNTDYFTVDVQGLTNAYRWETDSESFDADAPPLDSRKYKQRTLRLRFSRWGDEFEEYQDQIRFGIDGQLDYEWIYQ